MYDNHWCFLHCISWFSTVRVSVQKWYNSSKQHWMWYQIIDPFTYAFLPISNDLLNCRKYLLHTCIYTTYSHYVAVYVIWISSPERGSLVSLEEVSLVWIQGITSLWTVRKRLGLFRARAPSSSKTPRRWVIVATAYSMVVIASDINSSLRSLTSLQIPSVLAFSFFTVLLYGVSTGSFEKASIVCKLRRCMLKAVSWWLTHLVPLGLL